jgi:acetylornithine deacetylase/succinyl-diaminopimelate desuccinylase-like protein
MKIGNDWWTAPTESENGKLILVTGRRGVEAVRSTGKYKIRVEITWKYQGNAAGMPDDVTSTLMEDVQDAMSKTFDKDPIAVMTGVYTGDGERNWIFLHDISPHL